VRRYVVLVAGVLAAIVIVAVLAITISRIILQRRLAVEVDELLAGAGGGRPAVLRGADIAGLPEPVRRWLRYSQVTDRERPKTVRLKQVGQFRLGEEQAWMPFVAEQYYTTDPPGFIWAARFQLAPLVSIVGRDRYMEGTGSISMRLLSLVPVANKTGGGLNQGALLRYLNETMWFPAAAVNPYIIWESIDASSVRATMTYRGVTGSAVFVFDDQGRVRDMRAERYNDAKGRLLPWSTPITDYGEFAGVRIPVQGEGKWTYESGDFTYIRLRIMSLEYNPAGRFRP
jgi:hypothetical protein